MTRTWDVEISFPTRTVTHTFARWTLAEVEAFVSRTYDVTGLATVTIRGHRR